VLRNIFPLLAAVLLIGDGVLFGLCTNRWETNQALPAAVASLELVPPKIGDWQGKPLKPLDEGTLAQTGFAGYWQRRYDNDKTGSTVDVLLACGLPGPLSRHTPEICFAGRGFVLQKGPIDHREGAARFFKDEFGRPNAPGHLEIYYTWNSGAGWVAPQNPQWTFAGAPVLYKLYVAHDVVGDKDKDAAAEEDAREFLRALIPELEKKLAFGS
jgi:hypothetical protein